MTVDGSRSILLIGNDSRLSYLLQRYAERSGYGLTSSETLLAARDLTSQNPALIIFVSTELLEAEQNSVEQLTAREISIVTCAAAGGEARARELGADYCLLHPVTYDDFQAALATAISPRQV